MNESYARFPNGAEVVIRSDGLAIMPGLGRHRLVLQMSLSTANELADGTSLTLTGDAVAEGLGGTSGYLGTITPTFPITVRRDGNIATSAHVELTDDQIRRIDEHRNRSDGSFDLRLNLRLDGTDRNGQSIWTTSNMQPVRVSRDDWTNVLSQVGHRRVLVAELEIPDGALHPELAGALDHYRQAQTRYSSGDYRGTAESVRQALAVLVGEAPDAELSPDEMTTEYRNARKRQGGYDDRMELVRKALKFTADLGAHPETDQTMRAEALAQLHMAAGFIQWFTRPPT